MTCMRHGANVPMSVPLGRLDDAVRCNAHLKNALLLIIGSLQGLNNEP